LFDDDEPFYIREMRRVNYLQYEFVDFGEGHKWSPGTDDRYVNGKQILVRLNSVITPEQEFKNGKVDLEFISDELPYFETIYTTLELHDSGYSATAEKYGLVDNIDDEKVKYRFTESNFTVYNAGNVTVEPENMMLNIIINNLNGSKLTLKNKMTNEELIFENGISTGTQLRIEGMLVRQNLINRFRDTNKKFISLAPGENQIEITGITFEEIRF